MFTRSMHNSETKVALARRQQGGVLLVTLILGVLLGTALSAYLVMLTQQKKQLARSQAWNHAIAIAEAGVEEALAQINRGAYLGTNVPVNLFSANGWGATGLTYGPVSRTLSNGTYTAYFTQVDSNACPVIYSTGNVSVASMPATLTRAVKVCTTNLPMFSVGMATLLDINFQGHGVTTGSFNSQNVSNGLWTSAAVGTNGSIASIGGNVNVGVATVNGNVYLGPTATDAIQKNGVITGKVYNDYNFIFPDATLPTPPGGVWTTTMPGGTNIGTTNFSVVFPATGGWYQTASLSSSTTIYVPPGATVVLYVTGNASPSQIEIGSTPLLGSGTLKFYMGGASFNLSGSASVDSNYAKNFEYFGLPSNTSITFGGNASFTGTIYAPEADFSLGGGGNGNYDFVGASVTRSVKMNGHYNFHYDESLVSVGNAGFVACSWQEL